MSVLRIGIILASSKFGEHVPLIADENVTAKTKCAEAIQLQRGVKTLSDASKALSFTTIPLQMHTNGIFQGVHFWTRIE